MFIRLAAVYTVSRDSQHFRLRSVAVDTVYRVPQHFLLIRFYTVYRDPQHFLFIRFYTVYRDPQHFRSPRCKPQTLMRVSRVCERCGLTRRIAVSAKTLIIIVIIKDTVLLFFFSVSGWKCLSLDVVSLSVQRCCLLLFVDCMYI